MPLAKDGLKICSTCGEEKSVFEYHKDRAMADNLYCICKECKHKYREANRERYKENSRLWYRKNPWGNRASGLNRIAGFKFVTGDDLHTIYEQHNGLCYYCGCSVSATMPVDAPKRSGRKDKVTFDHVIPGIHEIKNLVLSCFTCNRRKQDNTVKSMKRFIRQVERHQKINGEDI